MTCRAAVWSITSEPPPGSRTRLPKERRSCFFYIKVLKNRRLTFVEVHYFFLSQARYCGYIVGLLCIVLLCLCKVPLAHR